MNNPSYHGEYRWNSVQWQDAQPSRAARNANEKYERERATYSPEQLKSQTLVEEAETPGHSDLVLALENGTRDTCGTHLAGFFFFKYIYSLSKYPALTS